MSVVFDCDWCTGLSTFYIILYDFIWVDETPVLFLNVSLGSLYVKIIAQVHFRRIFLECLGIVEWNYWSLSALAWFVHKELVLRCFL